MGFFSDISKSDSQWFANPDEFGEVISYTPFLLGVAQPTVSVTAVIDRIPADLMREGPQRVKQIHLKIPVSSAVGVGLVDRPLRGDKLTASWQVGETVSTFRVVDNGTQDAGMWDLTAEESKG